MRRHENGHLAVLQVSGANAPEPARVDLRCRFGVGDVDRVVARNRDPARPAELTPLVDEPAVLVENLDPVVLAIADQQPAARVDRDRVRLAEFAGPCAFAAPLLDESPVLRELHHAIVPAVAVTVGHENVAARRNDNVGGLIEEIRS